MSIDALFRPFALKSLQRRHRRFRDGRGDFDLVVVGRALLQDPEWLIKVREGRTEALQSFERSAMSVLY